MRSPDGELAVGIHTELVLPCPLAGTKDAAKLYLDLFAFILLFIVLISEYFMIVFE